MPKKNLLKGTLVLGIGGITAKVLGFFFRIPLIYMIGEEGIGLYQLTYPLYSFLLAISAGIPTALSKMISERNALHKQKEAYYIFKIALYILGVFGAISSLCIIIFSNSIITAFKWNKGAYYSLLGISLAPVFTCLLSAFKGYFQGLQEMGAPAISQVVEQLTRILVGVGLAYLLLSRGIAVSAGGASFGAAIGSLIGLMWMIHCFKKLRHTFSKTEKIKSKFALCKEILKLAVPISFGQAIGSIMALIDSIIVPGLLKASGYSEQIATQLYGQLTGKAFVLVNIPLTLSIALAQSTVPAISESYALGNRERLKRNIKMSYKLSMIIALPCAGGLYALARPILGLVFQGRGEGWELMQILAIASIFIIIAQTSTSILNGVGKILVPVISMFIGSVVKIMISIVFIPYPQFNIKAAAYGTLIAYIIVAFIDFVFVVKSTKIYISIKEVFISPAICTLVMIFAAIFVYSNIFDAIGSNTIATSISIVISGIVYAVMLLITKTLSINEIRSMLKK
jgi:stage V sporulation protein B